MRIGLFVLKCENAAVEQAADDFVAAPKHNSGCKEALPKKPRSGLLKWLILFAGCVIRDFEVALLNVDGAYDNIESKDDYDGVVNERCGPRCRK